MKISVFTKGKLPNRNEDALAYDQTSFVVCDGSTGKSKALFDGKTGGELASSLVARAALESRLNGKDLISYLTQLLREKKIEISNSESEVDIETTLVCARMADSKLIVTQVADTAFRINGNEVFENRAIIDIIMSQARATYIKLTDDIDGGRDYIMPLLLNERKYINNANSPAGLGVLNGQTIPSKYIKTFEFNLAGLKTLEIYTDGYSAIPLEVSIDAYETAHAKVQQTDPHKYLQYASTKSNDDRTVLIVDFS